MIYGGLFHKHMPVLTLALFDAVQDSDVDIDVRRSSARPI